MYRNRKCLGLLAVLALTIAIAAPMQCFGQSISQIAVDKAHDFLKKEKRGKQITELMHFGATYSGHEYLRISQVKDPSGNIIPGEFALVYRFWWDKQYSTELAVFCTSSGSVESVKPLRSDGIAQAPFLTAQATVSILGNALYEAFKEQMNETDKKKIRQFIDDADVKSLLEMQLKFQQALGQ